MTRATVEPARPGGTIPLLSSRPAGSPGNQPPEAVDNHPPQAVANPPSQATDSHLSQATNNHPPQATDGHLSRDADDGRPEAEGLPGRGTAYLLGAAYVLGERESDYTSIPNLAELAMEFQIPPNAELWGWGGIRRTDRSLEELAADSGAATLRAAGLTPGEIDALMLCSTAVPGPSEGHGTFVENVLTGIGLGDIPFYGQTLNRCVNLLAAVDVARAFVASGRYRRILVVTTDRVTDEAARMSNFALFSDGAASCVVSADPGEGGHEILACATAQDAKTLDWSNELSSDLARDVNRRLLDPLGMKLGDVDALMHANIFKPLVVMKERQAGFTPAQLHTGNIPRIGHCFAADPLINLVDRTELGHVRAGRLSILASSVPGSRIGVLLRALG